MSVQVISKRKFQIDKNEKLMPLLRELRILSEKQSGHISRKTLRSFEDPGEFLVICEWETADDWKKWLQSKERRDLQGKIDSLIGEKTFYEIFETVRL
jgi:heme-degrading monooxygenase HmoA